MSLSPDLLYPPIEPFSTQMLAVSPRHSLYVERSGKPGGYPVVFLHGGPGSQTRPFHRRYFDPAFFEVVLFDQRGCGRSQPAGETGENTTQDLVEDIHAVSKALGFRGRFSLFGGSWGSTLALAYALRYPQTLDELILRGIFLASADELEWYTHGLARFAPNAWENLARGMGENLIDSYHEAVFAADSRRASEAAARWVDYENRLMSPGATPFSGPVTPELLNRARVQLHYLKHRCFLDEPLLDAAAQLELPVTIVQGALDLICPPVTACRLSEALPDATFRLVSRSEEHTSE